MEQGEDATLSAAHDGRGPSVGARRFGMTGYIEDLHRANPDSLPLDGLGHRHGLNVCGMAAVLRLPAVGTKAALFAEISTYLSQKYNGFK